MPEDLLGRSWAAERLGRELRLGVKDRMDELDEISVLWFLSRYPISRSDPYSESSHPPHPSPLWPLRQTAAGAAGAVVGFLHCASYKAEAFLFAFCFISSPVTVPQRAAPTYGPSNPCSARSFGSIGR